MHGSRICLCRVHPSYSIRLSPLTAADTHTLSIRFVSSPTAGSPLDASPVLVVSNTVVVWSRLTPQVSPQSRTVIRPTTPRTRSTPTTPAHNTWCVCRCTPGGVTIPRVVISVCVPTTGCRVWRRRRRCMPAREKLRKTLFCRTRLFPSLQKCRCVVPRLSQTSRSRVVHRWSKYRVSLMVHENDAV